MGADVAHPLRAQSRRTLSAHIRMRTRTGVDHDPEAGQRQGVGHVFQHRNVIVIYIEYKLINYVCVCVIRFYYLHTMCVVYIL